MQKHNLQELKKEYKSQFDVAFKYYSIINILNDLKLKRKELQLLAFIAVRGSISYGGKKEEFIELYGSSNASIGNIISFLSKKELLEKKNGKNEIIAPLKMLDFSLPITLQLHINAERPINKENQ